jgi:hypothetical protein
MTYVFCHILLLPKTVGTMYYMQSASHPSQSSSQPWSSRGFLDAIRTGLPTAHRLGLRATEAASQKLQQIERDAPQARLTGDEVDRVAFLWRLREQHGDRGAHLVADALESVAEQRRMAAMPRSRAAAIGQRITDFMRI